MTLPNGCVTIDGLRMTPDIVDDAPQLPHGSQEVERPFAGIRVLDLGVIVVGAETGRLLADQGADVVKVESRAFPDGNRQSYLPYGLSVSFAAGHRNKRGLGLDLRDPRGKALFLRLVEQADVVLSNFKPGTMESLGLGMDVLAAANPRIVSVESSAFGDTGPWSRRMGYGPLVRAATGVTKQWRYPDDSEGFSDSITIYPDHVAARIGALAAIALLIRRERTGRGGAASIAQAEVVLSQFGQEIAALCGGQSVSPQDPRSAVYRCSGEDAWCVVSDRASGDAAAIARVTNGEPLTDWLASRDAREAACLLQAAGVPAAPMLRVADLPAFDYYRERGMFRTERHPHLVEDVVVEARQAIGSTLAAIPAAPAPLMGENSREILDEWIGPADIDIDGLIADAVVQTVSEEEMEAIRRAFQTATDSI